jgi:hypothetical protein
VADPAMRALKANYDAMADRPDLAWRFLERELGPTPEPPEPDGGPTVIVLTFPGPEDRQGG